MGESSILGVQKQEDPQFQTVGHVMTQHIDNPRKMLIVKEHVAAIPSADGSGSL